MKVTVIANVSANGRALVSNDPRYQVPQEAFDFYLHYAQQVGNLVIGRQTFDHFQTFSAEVKALFQGIEILVLSKGPAVAGYTFVSSPAEALSYMEAKGASELAIGGGVGTFNAFIDQELVTDLYLNINPILLGNEGVVGTNPALHTAFHIQDARTQYGFVQLHLTAVK
ncbi:dihydrofolate reductase family protein [Myroides sp. DW712]|uniref:dihydrofolate reductase family protein n=1 Tax=Myroides sp. DW712 TaxID=3389800 RepID=UPI00397916CC